MAKGMDKFVEASQSLGTAIVGGVIWANQTIIPALPEMVHMVGGIALIVAGLAGTAQKFMK